MSHNILKWDSFENLENSIGGAVGLMVCCVLRLTWDI
jgi:hypothetical protein